jgi:DNA-binding response OmpR family regulator
MKSPEAYLVGKWILAVDDEPDILEALEEILDICNIHTATAYETARELLDMNRYDAVIIDIMGVRGYDLLNLARKKRIPTLILTAHALNPGNLKKSITSGAGAYIPKDKMADMAIFLAELIETAQSERTLSDGRWFSRLRVFFDEKFGSGWKDKEKKFWDSFEKNISF